jgi:fructokinase
VTGAAAEEAPVICLGEALIDLVAQDIDAPIGRASGFTRAPGGAPANVAVGIARLGRRATFVGRVGEDEFGRALIEELTQNGVDTSSVRCDPEARTGLAFVGLSATGDRQFLFYRDRAADVRLSPDDLPVAEIRRSAALHVGTFSLAGEPSATATRHALELAREAGAVRSCDLNLRRDVWRSVGNMLSAASELVAASDIVKASAEEATQVTGESDPLLAAQALRNRGPRLVVVTMGAQGAAFATQHAAGVVPPWRVRAVDSTGAGDAFVAAMLVELMRRGMLAAPEAQAMELPAVLTVANAAGAFTTARRGVILALPTRGELDAFIAVGSKT